MAGIDREKLRATMRKIDNETIFYMLDEALALLPETKLEKLVARHLDIKRLRPDDNPVGRGLLAEVIAFDKASRKGEYREAFMVNSKNFMEKSKGTRAWIAECNRLLDVCVGQAKKSNPEELRQAIELIFDLLRKIDEGYDDIVFFADEAGLWQVGVNWGTVLPAWFHCLSTTAEPEEYATKVITAIRQFENYRCDEHLATARRTATAAQRRALAAAMGEPSKPR